MSLDMSDHIDDDFESMPATRYVRSGARDSEGVWVEGAKVPKKHKVTVQPLSGREISNLGVGGTRIEDYRKIYINDGELQSLTPQDEWVFSDMPDDTYKVHSMDNRPWRSYCKLMVRRNDR